MINLFVMNYTSGYVTLYSILERWSTEEIETFIMHEGHSLENCYYMTTKNELIDNRIN